MTGRSLRAGLSSLRDGASSESPAKPSIPIAPHDHYAYDISMPEGGWPEVDNMEPAEKAKLRPIAETLAMLDGNAFFTVIAGQHSEWYEMYLPEAKALYESNGGDGGWAGEASFARAARGMEAGTDETGTGSACDSPVRKDAP